MQNTITFLDNINTAQQAILDKARQGVSDLRVLIEKSYFAPKKVGDHFGGGIVFYVDATGQHGLIAALSDLTDGVVNYRPWNSAVLKTTGATGDGIGAGAANTTTIVAAKTGDRDFVCAAKVANDYTVHGDAPYADTVDETCYGDWYLPSKFELNLLYQQKSIVGGFVDSLYWSSTENDAYCAWAQYFCSGSQHNLNKKHALRVRAVRAF
jgi:hypothetical protein